MEKIWDLLFLSFEQQIYFIKTQDLQKFPEKPYKMAIMKSGDAPLASQITLVVTAVIFNILILVQTVELAHL